MSKGAIYLLLGVGGVFLLWHCSGGFSIGSAGPTDTNDTGQAVPSDPTSTSLNNQSGSFSTGVQT